MSREHTRTLADDVDTWFDGEDRGWADAVMLRLLLDGVPEARTREALLEVHDLVASSGESASELFGEPHDFVTEHLSQWREEGLPHRDADDESLAAVVAVQWGLAAIALGGITAVPALWGEPVTWSVGTLIAPAMLSVLLAAVLGVYRFGTARHSRGVGVAAATLVTVLGTVAGAGVFMGLPPAVPGPVWWVVPYLAGHLLVAALVLKVALARDARPRPVAATPDDEAWATQVAARLRMEVGFTDARAEQVVAEARAHVAAAGSTLVEEFGEPASFTARQTPDVASTRRREAAVYGVAAVLALVVLASGFIDGGGVSWWALGFVVCLTLLAAGAWRGSRTKGRGAGR